MRPLTRATPAALLPTRLVLLVLLALALLCGASTTARAQATTTAPTTTADLQKDSEKPEKTSKRGDVLIDSPDAVTQYEQLWHAAVRLPIAAGLACVLALRPRRRGTPRRQPPVIQTQIILAIVGAVVMLVVGSSLARAFGIVGAAGLVRYRAKIEDPKDAGVMLSTLAIGLAAGVGLWMLAMFTTVFILVVLWVVESFEPRATKPFTLVIKTKDPAARKPDVERVLARWHVDHELRTTSKEELAFDVHLPIERKTDKLSEQILELDRDATVQWEEKKEKK